MNRRGLLALVHCARRDLALSEDTYRTVLEQVAGASSARDLSDAQLGRVVEHFRRLGWAPQKGTRQISQKPHVRKVWALWRSVCDLGGARAPTPASLRAFVQRLTGVTDPEWLTVAQAAQVIENLKTWQARLRRERRDGGPCPT